MFAKLFILSFLYVNGCFGYSHSPGDADYCPEDKENDDLRRPCPDLSTQCVQAYFLKHGHCKTPTSDEPYLEMDKLLQFIPTFNITVVAAPTQIFGSNNAKITEFFVNPETNRILLSLKFRNIKILCTVHQHYYEQGKEVVVFEPFSLEENYDVIETTTLFRGILSPDLTESETHAKRPILNSYALGEIECNARLHANIDAIVNDLPSYVSESFVTRGSSLVNYWFQQFICDYDVKYDEYLYAPV